MTNDATSELDDNKIAGLCYFEEAYDGPGWYWFDAEHPDEGTIGRFLSREEARRAAAACGYLALPKEDPSPFKIRPRPRAATQSPDAQVAAGFRDRLEQPDDDDDHAPWSDDE